MQHAETSVRPCLAILLCFLCCNTNVDGCQSTKAITYNTALLDPIGSSALGPDPNIPSRTVRRDAIIEQLKKPKNRGDILCLQEVWMAEDAYTITEGLKSSYPYSYSKVHDGPGNTIPLEGYSDQPPCPQAEFTALAACLVENGCNALTGDAIFGCALASCPSQIAAVPHQCRTCFSVSFLDSNTVQSCVMPNPQGTFRRMNKPGLILLSRRPLENPRYTYLHPGTNEVFEKGYIHAKVLGNDESSSENNANEFDVVCTHTTDYDGAFYFELELAYVGITSFAQQGLMEITTLIDTFSNYDKLLLLGDLNVGPGIGSSVIPMQPDYFDMLSNSFSVEVIGECTFCQTPENRYVAGSSQMIDHIFYKGFKVKSKDRIVDDVKIGTGNGFYLSDHFGVKQRLQCLKDDSSDDEN